MNTMTNNELFAAYQAAEYQSEQYEELHEEINRRVRAEVVKQLDESVAGNFLSDAAADAILRGFDNAATWHFDAARSGGFDEKSLEAAVSDYLSDECDVYACQHEEN